MAHVKGSSKTPERSRPGIYARVSSKQRAEANTIASQIEALKRVSWPMAYGWSLNCASSTRATAAEHFFARLWSASVTKLRLAPSTGSMFTRRIASPVATPIKCFLSRNFNDMASRSSSSTMTSAALPRKISCSRFKG